MEAATAAAGGVDPDAGFVNRKALVEPQLPVGNEKLWSRDLELGTGGKGGEA